jgi:hypothetical protein
MCLTESFYLLNPPHHQAANRCASVWKKEKQQHNLINEKNNWIFSRDFIRNNINHNFRYFFSFNFWLFKHFKIIKKWKKSHLE